MWSHDRPNGQKYTSPYYDTDLEQNYSDCGENLAKGPDDTSTAQMLLDALMASPGHRANIMKSEYDACSIAVYYPNGGNVYMAQEFVTYR